MTFTSFKEFLLEMPSLIGDTDFGLDDSSSNKKLGDKLRANKKLEKIEDLKDGFALYRINRMFVVFYQNESKIYYLMKFNTKTIQMIRETAATQIAVWAEQPIGRSLNIAKTVFFDYLLPEWHIISTDRHQTDDGAGFWGKRVNEALEKNLWIYFIDQVSNLRKMVRIVNRKQLEDLDIWGSGQKYEARKLLISDKQLHPISGVDLED